MLMADRVESSSIEINNKMYRFRDSLNSSVADIVLGLNKCGTTQC